MFPTYQPSSATPLPCSSSSVGQTGSRDSSSSGPTVAGTEQPPFGTPLSSATSLDVTTPSPSHPMITHSKTGSLRRVKYSICQLSHNMLPFPDHHLRPYVIHIGKLQSSVGAVLCPLCANIVRSHWLSRDKFNGDSRLQGYKSRLVAQVFHNNQDWI